MSKLRILQDHYRRSAFKVAGRANPELMQETRSLFYRLVSTGASFEEGKAALRRIWDRANLPQARMKHIV